jgi:hypothetical protein
VSLSLSLSTLTLSAAVAAEFVVLRAIAQEALVLSKKLQPKTEKLAPREQALGTQVKSFRARMLDAPDDVIKIDLRGKTSFLLFVEPRQIEPSARAALGAVLHTFQRRYESSVFLVCCGQVDECRQFLQHYGLTRGIDAETKVVLDENRELVRLFSIHAFPTGIVIDEDGRVAKVGSIEAG